jgi:hypothetical protein
LRANLFHGSLITTLNTRLRRICLPVHFLTQTDRGRQVFTQKMQLKGRRAGTISSAAFISETQCQIPNIFMPEIGVLINSTYQLINFC